MLAGKLSHFCLMSWISLTPTLKLCKSLPYCKSNVWLFFLVFSSDVIFTICIVGSQCAVLCHFESEHTLMEYLDLAKIVKKLISITNIKWCVMLFLESISNDLKRCSSHDFPIFPHFFISLCQWANGKIQSDISTIMSIYWL